MSKRAWIERIGVVAAVAAGTVALQATVAQAFYIPSPSMAPTLQVNDRIVVEKAGYSASDVRRGDIVVFSGSRAIDETCGGVHLDRVVKRVVALPGDEVVAYNGLLYVNDRPANEPYLPPTALTTNLPEQTVPAGTVWVMGDNREDSCDSRFWGPLPVDRIVGKAFVLYWPPKDARVLP